MTLRGKVELVAVFLVLVAVALIVPTWIESQNDRLKLQSTLDSQNAVIQQAQQKLKALQDADKLRDLQTQADIAAMRRAAGKAKTPQQIAAWLPSQLPTPSPVIFKLPAPSATNPTPAAVVTVPQNDLPVLRNFVESCKECTANLQAAQQDAASKTQQLQLAGEQLAAAERERDAAIAASKGGTLWRRLARNSRWFLFGAATTAAAACVTHRCP